MSYIYTYLYLHISYLCNVTVYSTCSCVYIYIYIWTCKSNRTTEVLEFEIYRVLHYLGLCHALLPSQFVASLSPLHKKS